MNKNSLNTDSKKVFIIGVGNTLRSDDGIGAYICSQIENLNIEGVITSIVHQLHVELIEELIQYNSVIIVDAAVNGKDVDFVSLEYNKNIALSSSHHLNADMLNVLTQKMYGQNIPFFLCSVRGENFNLGETLSPNTISNANKAIEIICDWIKK